jgi:hypothetical protein
MDFRAFENTTLGGGSRGQAGSVTTQGAGGFMGTLRKLRVEMQTTNRPQFGC